MTPIQATFDLIRSLVHEGRAMRWLPHTGGTRRVRPCPPYWNPHGQVDCVEVGYFFPSGVDDHWSSVYSENHGEARRPPAPPGGCRVNLDRRIKMSIKTIQEEIKTAIEALEEGWEWAQDFVDAEGERHVIDGPAWIAALPDDKSRDAAKAYDESVASDYAGAQEELEKASGLLESGDISGALEAAEEAARFEQKTGDAMFCRPIMQKIEKIEEDIEEGE